MPIHTIPNFMRRETLSASTDESSRYQGTRRFRILTALTGAVLLSSAVLLTILNALGVLHLSDVWLTVLNTILIVLGIGGTLGQWLLPLASPPSTSMTDSQHQPTLTPVEALRQTIEGELNPRLPKGALVIVTSEQDLSMPIHLIPHRTWLKAASLQVPPGYLPGTQTKYVKHIRCGETVLCAAIFRDQIPDEYLLHSDFHAHTPVPIFEQKLPSLIGGDSSKTSTANQ